MEMLDVYVKYSPAFCSDKDHVYLAYVDANDRLYLKEYCVDSNAHPLDYRGYPACAQ